MRPQNKQMQNFKNASKFVDIGFNHIMPSKDGAIIFGGCPNLAIQLFVGQK